MSLTHDIRFAIRLLVKARWFTVAAAATLGIGIAVNTAVFTLANTVLFRGVPFTDADRIVVITMRELRNREVGVSYLDFRDWREATRTFSSMALMSQLPFNINEQSHTPDRYAGASVSSALFTVLKEQPLIGRSMLSTDDQTNAPPVALLSHGMWQNRYGSDASIIGQTIKVNDMSTTVIGVMKPGMQFPPNTDIWLALERAPFTRGQPRQSRIFQVIARLADGVTLEEAQRELAGIVARLAKEYPSTNKDLVPIVTPINERLIGPQLSLMFFVLMGAVGFVLLIACANVTNLQLARAVVRSKEIALRMSLGASRWRIVRQLLVENVLLALLGGTLSLPLSLAAVTLFDRSTSGAGKPYWMTFSMDVRVLMFFLASAGVAGVAVGLTPALQVLKTNINETLKESGRSASSGANVRRWGNWLLVGEVAFTVILLAGAGAMMQSFMALYQLNLGIDTSRLLLMQLTLTDRKYPTQEMKRTFLRRLDDRLVGSDVFQSATTASNWPLGGGTDVDLTVEGQGETVGQRRPIVTMVNVGRRYFETVGLSVPRGRKFIDDDTAMGREGAIVNQRFVDVHFSRQNPIGRRIILSSEGPPAVALPPLTIVGVSANLLQRVTPTLEPDPVVYVHNLAIPAVGRPMALMVRTRGADQGPVVQSLRNEVRALDPDIPLANVQSMNQHLARQRWTFRIFGLMFAAFAAIAVFLAAIGLYAATAYSVTQRTREIGVRMALGASPGNVVWLFASKTLSHAITGLTLGTVGAVGVQRLLQSVLVDSQSRDAIVLMAIWALILVVCAAASVGPLRRAVRLDPLMALRWE